MIGLLDFLLFCIKDRGLSTTIYWKAPYLYFLYRTIFDSALYIHSSKKLFF